MGSWVQPLSFTSVRSLFFCSPHPSLAAIGLLFRAPSTRCILLLLPLSWLTDSLSSFLPSSGYFSSTRCRLLLLWCRFFVSARAPPCSLASSGLTATFWSSSSSSSHSRAASARHFSSVLLLQLHLVVVCSDEAAGAHSSTAVLYSATAFSLVRRHCGSLPQLGLLLVLGSWNESFHWHVVNNFDFNVPAGSLQRFPPVS